MRRTIFRVIAVTLLVLMGCGTPAPPPEPDAHDHDPHQAEHSVDDLVRFGVEIATAGPGEVDLGVELPGEVRPNGDRLAHLAPRFPGLVREVRKQAGDVVRAGEVLAVIESDTLAPYDVRAPFDGTIIDRHVAAGETVDPQRPAFIVADLRTVWVDVAVYQKALQAVQPGREVRIATTYGEGDAQSVVSYVAPVVDQATRTATARIVLSNADGKWRPGVFVTVTALTPVEAAVVVPRTAILPRGDERVVFVADAERFAARPVIVGRVGRTRAEITAGLAVGERYAAEGAFLVKAELGKADAGHEH